MTAPSDRRRHADDRRGGSAARPIDVGDEVQDPHVGDRPWSWLQVARARLLQRLQGRMGSPCDPRELGFVVCSFRQTELLADCTERLRRFFPEASLAVISDGDPDPDLDPLCQRRGARLVVGERLKLPGRGAEYLARLLRVFLDSDGRVLVKIDPDSRIERAFRYLPRGQLAGTVIGRGTPFFHLQGGCQVLRREAVAKLLATAILDDPRYREVEAWCPSEELRARLVAYERARGVATVDHMLLDATARGGLRPTHWHEVACWWPSPPACPEGLFAITHPHGAPRRPIVP